MNKTTNKGKLSVIGTGPGNPEHITAAARKAILEADIIIGYRTYIEQIPELLEGKEVLSSTMMQEVERCRKALNL
ncbi:Cobalt-precorrin-3 C(17)-methyltransferase, partial [hydrothermal vent metagenome]